MSDRRRLEKATHPSILREMTRLVGKLKGVVVVDVPLLFEKKLQKKFDATLLVACRPQAQLKRVMRRDGYTAAEVRRRVKAQLPLGVKRRLSDHTIDNDGTLAELRAKTRTVYAGLSLLYGGTPNGNAGENARAD
jgi:dephospho-CoA kinase